MRLTILKGILRGAVRDRLMTALNALGMTAGLTAGILILSFALQEHAHDEFHERADRIYRIDEVVTRDGEPRRWADSPLQLRDELAASFPDVEASTRFHRSFGVIQFDDVIQYQGFTLVDPDFLSIFSFELLEGNPDRALSEPGSVVLSRSAARRYFPDGNALGRSLRVKLRGETFKEVTVTGVIEDPPETSSLQFAALLPLEPAIGESIRQSSYDRWRGQTATFALLNPTVDTEAFDRLLDGIVDKYSDAILFGRDEVNFTVTPLTDIYFDYAVPTRGNTESSNPRTANSLIALALLIIGIAAANFTTLSIARSTRQNRAVGIRKVIGASKWEIAREYLSDSLLKTIFSAVVALGLAEVLSKPFSTLAGSPVEPSILFVPRYMLTFGVLVLGVGFLSGFYPALHLSRIRPIGILHGTQSKKSASYLIRAVVVVQFAATAVLLIAAWTMSKQVKHLNSVDLGIETENVLVVEPDFTNTGTVPAVHRLLEASSSPAIGQVARSSGMIARAFGSVEIQSAGGTEHADMIGVSQDVLDILGINVIAGSSIEPARPNELLVNRPFVELLKSDPERAVGQSINDVHTIAGVVSDFYHHSVRNEPRPLALYPIADDQEGGYLMVRTSPGQSAAAIADVRDAWTRVAPDVPFQYYWLDDDLEQQAGSTARWNRVMRTSTLFALLIACLGLFGLSTLTAVRRTKEVGIRKVLGADPLRVTGLLVRETTILACVAAVVAIPIGWWIMHVWLQDFASRVPIRLGELGLLSAGLVLIALITVSYQSLRVAIRNPVESLRHE